MQIGGEFFEMITDAIKTYWKQSLAYRGEYLISVLVVPLRFFLILFIWHAVFTANGLESIENYTLESLITYFMVSTLVYIMIYDDSAERLEEHIKKGDFMIYLLKPTSYIRLELYRKIAHRLFSLLAEVLPVMLIFFLFFRQYIVPGNILPFLISVAFSFMISFLIYMLIGMMAFWLVNIRTLAWLISFTVQFASGLFVPLDLLPKAIDDALQFLPFRHLIYTPVSIYLGTADVYLQLALQALWCLILGIIAYLIWKKAIRNFTGVGA